VARAVTEDELAREAQLILRICGWLALVVTALALLIAWLLPAEWLASESVTSHEIAPAIWLVLASLPAVVITGILRGILEGRMYFGTANALKVAFGTWTFGAPAVVALWLPVLPALVGAVACGRWLGLLVHWLAVRDFLDKRTDRSIRSSTPIGPLVVEGGWLTVSNVVGPLMVTFDRFAVGAFVSLAAVAYYMIPQEVALRLLLLPMALAVTVFPMLARASAGEAKTAARSPSSSSGRSPSSSSGRSPSSSSGRSLAQRGLLAAMVLGLPLSVLFVAGTEPVLAYWMGPEFARAGTTVSALLACGLFANSVAQIPFAAIQAAGRSDVTGRLHVCELPIYGALLLLLIPLWGINGAALAWTLRAAGDCLALLWLARRLDLMVLPVSAMTGLAAGVLLVAAAALVAVLADGRAYIVLLGLALAATALVSVAWGRRLYSKPVGDLP
jgi:O-antigen/teichoic acid export membrane protein